MMDDHCDLREHRECEERQNQEAGGYTQWRQALCEESSRREEEVARLDPGWKEDVGDPWKLDLQTRLDSPRGEPGRWQADGSCALGQVLLRHTSDV